MDEMNNGQVPPQGGYQQVPPPQQVYGQVPPQGGYQQVPPQGYGQMPPQGYGQMPPAKKKKSALVPILIVTIVAILIATGVLLYFFVFRSKGGDAPGEYHMAAVEVMGVTINAREMPGVDEFAITLNEGGTGTFTYSSNTLNIKWTLDGTNLDIVSDDGKKISDYLSASGGNLEFKNGRIYCSITQNGMSGTSILAKSDDDLSDIEMTSLADAIQKLGSAFGQ